MDDVSFVLTTVIDLSAYGIYIARHRRLRRQTADGLDSDTVV